LPDLAKKSEKRRKAAGNKKPVSDGEKMVLIFLKGIYFVTESKPDYKAFRLGY
jgi:hypothetical protein